MRHRARLCGLFLCAYLIAGHVSHAEEVMPIEPDEPVLEATLRGLDKATGRVRDIPISRGLDARFGTLTIRLHACKTSPREDRPETIVFLEIFDRPLKDTPRTRIFSGWMFASSPSINALEHAVYDVWVISCKMREGEASKGNR